MLEEAKVEGLIVNSVRESEVLGRGAHRKYLAQPNPDAIAHQSLTGAWSIAELIPKKHHDWEKDRLHKKWQSTPIKTASRDNAVENLSSLVVVAESGGRRMLLTGDARGDYILEGLQDAGYMEGGVCKIDVLKLPHHGSSRNCTQSLFDGVYADHYIISANGKYENPDTETLCRLAEARGDDPDYKVHWTNAPKSSPTTPEEIASARNINDALEKYPWLDTKLAYRPENSSIRIDLLDEL
jgi:hypothetical protein